MEQAQWAGFTTEELSGILVVPTTTAVLFWYLFGASSSRLVNSIGGGFIALLAMVVGLRLLN